VLGVVCAGAAVGSIPVALTGYAEAAGARSLTGWLLACQAAGALAGGLLYTRAKSGGRHRLAVGYLPLLTAPAPPGMALLQALSGVMVPPVLTAVFLTADRLPHPAPPSRPSPGSSPPSPSAARPAPL